MTGVDFTANVGGGTTVVESRAGRFPAHAVVMSVPSTIATRWANARRVTARDLSLFIACDSLSLDPPSTASTSRLDQEETIASRPHPIPHDRPVRFSLSHRTPRRCRTRSPFVSPELWQRTAINRNAFERTIRINHLFVYKWSPHLPHLGHHGVLSPVVPFDAPPDRVPPGHEKAPCGRLRRLFLAAKENRTARAARTYRVMCDHQ